MSDKVTRSGIEVRECYDQPAKGATAIGKPRQFKSVSAAFKNPASPTANVWVGGSYPTNSAQGTVVVYDVFCN